MRDCHQYLRAWMECLGMETEVDAIGNLRGIHRAAHQPAPRLIVASHLDTVPDAGAFDGVLGVVLGIALIHLSGDRQFPFDIEIIGFAEEEGVRFGTPFIGSKAFIGMLDDELLSVKDSRGITVKEAIDNFGLDSSRIAAAADGSAAFAYLEFHIEQGPVLESLNRRLAVVDAIAGQSRLSILFRGKSNHAGTTPMHLRQDALAGAAEWIGLVERFALSTPGLVATTGSIQARPGAGNVICGEARVSLDVRHASDEIRRAAVARLIELANELAQRRSLSIEVQPLLDQPAVGMDATLVAAAEHALAEAGVEPFRMTSGAGHDAMIVAAKIPAVMLFLRSPGGVSHHPDETVHAADVELALAAGLALLDQLAARAG